MFGSLGVALKRVHDTSFARSTLWPRSPHPPRCAIAIWHPSRMCRACLSAALWSPLRRVIAVGCPGQGHYRWATLLWLTARRAGLTPQRPPSVRHGAFLTALATYPEVTATLRCLVELLPCRGVNALPAHSLFRYRRPLSAKAKRSHLGTSWHAPLGPHCVGVSAHLTQPWSRLSEP